MRMKEKKVKSVIARFMVVFFKQISCVSDYLFIIIDQMETK